MKVLISSFPKPKFHNNENYFSSLVKYIIYQQLSGKSAFAIFNRYKMLFENEDHKNPSSLLLKNDSDLVSVGLSKQKITYIKSVAYFFHNNLLPADLSNYSDDQIKNILININGIGPWTINMFLIFTLKREDVMPFSDLVIQKAFQKYYKLDFLPSVSFMQEKSQLWSPYNSIAAIYLWRLVDTGFQW